ncbi:hypothetical protein [Nonlabens ulvanivorans]|uniref:hypothetical protein n=1 Tax=Nonlabens ulvanivorans TaxID=906888 RepID=UPI0029427C50|nr:hypothetical protein [Nonlabens ulvanivorans]WOI22742.1 hypothetical protein R1T42_13850 [Nonlabens ulvanivorans]
MKQIEIKGNQLIVRVEPAKEWVRTVLIALLGSLILLALFILYLMIENKGIHLIYFLGLLILGLLGWHFIRMFLWNRNGKEILTIEGNKLKYIAYYGKFKDGVQEMNLTQEIKAVVNDHNHRPHKSILFEDVSESQTQQEGIASVIKLKYSKNEDFYKLEHDLNVWLMKFRD